MVLSSINVMVHQPLQLKIPVDESYVPEMVRRVSGCGFMAVDLPLTYVPETVDPFWVNVI